jgi:multiple sugar transport system ATP-binding protein
MSQSVRSMPSCARRCAPRSSDCISKQGSTSIYVTHDQVEAMSLADRIVIMHEGVLQQVGSPTEVYTIRPTLFVAQFVGSPVMNILDASVSDAGGNVRVLVEGATDGFAFPPELTQKLDAGRRPAT